MKTLFKALVPLAILMVAMCFLVSTAQADTGAQSAGITNATITANTTNSALGVSVVSVKNHTSALLSFTATARTTNTVNTTLTFARVDASGNVETVPRFTWVIPVATSGDGTATTTNSIVALTNLTSSVIGDATGLKLISVANPLGCILDSPTLRVDQKNTR